MNPNLGTFIWTMFAVLALAATAILDLHNGPTFVMGSIVMSRLWALEARLTAKKD